MSDTYTPRAGDTITTAEALDVLPVGSVVLDGMGDAWQRSDSPWLWWESPNPLYDSGDADGILELGGTANPPTVLYVPGERP